MIKKIILILIVLTAFISCDNRKENILDITDKPTIEFYTPLRANSIKIRDSLKKSQGFYLFNLATTSATKKNELEYNKFNGTDSIVGQKVFYKPSIGNLNGSNLYKVKITDAFGKSAEAELILFYFLNFTPVTSLTINKTGVQAPNEYEFDASKSFDQDAKFGGFVMSYEYKINSVLVYTTPSSKIRHIFSTPGTYQIEVRCKDNDGAFSGSIIEFLTVQ